MIEPPTLHNLGFEWFIQGDANRNATVEVAYRKQGTTRMEAGAAAAAARRRAHLRRVPQSDVVAPNMFAGSILDLEPDTAYEAHFALSIPTASRARARADRDGAHAAEPKPYEGGRVFHVYPHGFKARRSSRPSRA